MSEDRAFLAALQLADSTLPIGRFAHSYGLEALIAREPDTDSGELLEIVATHILESAGTLDGVAVAAAHRLASADDVDGLHELDRLVTGRKLTASAREASTRCGRRLAALVPLLTTQKPAIVLAAAARDGQTDANLPVVHGVLAQACGIERPQAILVELRGAATALLSALVRLGRLPAFQAQTMLSELAPVLITAAHTADRTPAESMRSSALELEIHAIAHTRSTVRHFVT